MLGLGNVWSQSFINPSPPTEANTFYDEGCHWTWLQFFTWAGKVNRIFPVYVFPIWTEPSMQPDTNNGELYEHSTEWTSALRGMTQALPLPISQKDTYAFPEPMSKNLSFSSNHDTSKIASFDCYEIYFFFNDSDCLDCASFESLDMDGTCANDTKVGCWTNGEDIGWMRRPFHAGDRLILVDGVLAKRLLHR